MKDKDGNTVISNTPIPEEYETKAKKIGSNIRSSPKEIRKYQAEQEANEQRREAESIQRQQINEANEVANRQRRQAQEQQEQAQEQQEQAQRNQQNIQDIRNREADRLEAAVQQNIPGSRGMTASQRCMLTNAALLRAGSDPISCTSTPSLAIDPGTGRVIPVVPLQ